MKWVVRILVWLVGAVVAVAALGAGLFAYFIYTPEPAPPQLSGAFTEGAIDVGGHRRTYALYVPGRVAERPALVMALHSSDGSAQQMRRATGFAFERLADQHGFVVVYPHGYEGNWNGCNVVGDYSANTLSIDDVEFLTALIEEIAATAPIDRTRVFAAGLSRGGHMAYRLALEAPTHFRGVAVMAANLPSTDNFKCAASEARTSSIIILNGTADPLNPFEGGEVRIFGMFSRGTVLSAQASAQYFADLNGITTTPARSETAAGGNIRIERLLWHTDAAAEVELVALHGSGHVVPQPYWRHPRLLGPTPREPNGPELIWSFFERQR